MLVVTRRRDEQVLLYDAAGNVIRVTVLKTGSGSIRLGIDAPQSVRIVRAEIDRPRSEKESHA